MTRYPNDNASDGMDAGNLTVSPKDGFLTNVWLSLQSLALSGAALGVFFALSNFAHLEGESRDWVFYAIVCVSTALVYFAGQIDWNLRKFRWTTAACGVAGLVWLVRQTLFSNGNGLLAFAALVIWALAAHERRRHDLNVGRCFAVTAPLLVAAFAMLYTAGRLLFWLDLAKHWKRNKLLLPVLLIGILLLWKYMRVEKSKDRNSQASSGSACYSVMLFVIFLESFRTFGLFEMLGTAMHWDCYVGPVDLVRQGGYLLWNVPSQYGFLNILLASFMPVKSAWDSVFLLGGICQFSMSWAVFHHLCRNRKPAEVSVAGLLTIVAIHVIPGYQLTGSMVYPSVSALRFLWVILMFVILYRLAVVPAIDRKRHRVVIEVCWVFGFLWSVESAYYCTVTLGSYLTAEYCSQISVTRKFIRRLSLLVRPLSFLACAGLFITCFYLIRLRHLPDWRAFVEHATSFQQGFGALPIDIHGGVLYVLGILSVLAFMLHKCEVRRVRQSVFAIMSGTVAVLSYFIGRSHENNISNIYATLFVGLILSYWLFAESSSIDLRPFVIALLSPILILGIGNREFYTHLWNTWNFQNHHLDPLLPSLPKGLEELLTQISSSAGGEIQSSLVLVSYDDSVVTRIHANSANTSIANQGSWLPVRPAAVLVPLSPVRIRKYIGRWRNEHSQPGWLVYANDKQLFPNVIDAILAEVGDSYDLKAELRNDTYTARYYSPKPTVSAELPDTRTH